MQKYIAQIIYFPSILSQHLCLMLNWEKTSDKTDLSTKISISRSKPTKLSSFTQRKLEWVMYNTQVLKFLPLRKKNSNKILKFGKPCFPRGRVYLPGQIFPRGSIFWWDFPREVFTKEGGGYFPRIIFHGGYLPVGDFLRGDISRWDEHKLRLSALYYEMDENNSWRKQGYQE